MASDPYNWDYNIEKATSMIKDAVGGGADICLLPEAFIPGYSLTSDNFRYAEKIDGKTISIIKNLAAELKVYISGSIIEKTEKDFYNNMFFIGPEGIMGTYRKMFVYSLENRFWKRGKDPAIIDTKFGKIGLGICADMHYPKLWKKYASEVNLILICSAWPNIPDAVKFKFAKHENQLCRDLPTKISQVFQIPVAYCNAAQTCKGKFPMVGSLNCAGFSKIVNNGVILEAIDSREEKIIMSSVNIPDNPPEIDQNEFKDWIKYSFTEVIPKFLFEKFLRYYSYLSYKWNKGKFLKD
jgi:predicted amidohydrolase